MVSSGWHEFILWDLENFEIVKFEKKKRSKYPRKFVAKFHPSRNQFVLISADRIRFFDAGVLDFVDEIKLRVDDIRSELKSLCFSQDGSLLFVGTSQRVYVIDFETKVIIKIIDLIDILNSSNIFHLAEEKYPLIDEIMIDKQGKTFYIISNRNLISIDIKNEQVINSYWHLGDFRNADFTGAKGIDRIVAEHLYKNGAIIEWKDYPPPPKTHGVSGK